MGLGSGRSLRLQVPHLQGLNWCLDSPGEGLAAPEPQFCTPQAKYKGFYREVGLDVRLISAHEDGFQTMPAERLFRKEVHFAMAPSETVISYNVRGGAGKAVMKASVLPHCGRAAPPRADREHGAGREVLSWHWTVGPHTPAAYCPWWGGRLPRGGWALKLQRYNLATSLPAGAPVGTALTQQLPAAPGVHARSCMQAFCRRWRLRTPEGASASASRASSGLTAHQRSIIVAGGGGCLSGGYQRHCDAEGQRHRAALPAGRQAVGWRAADLAVG